MHVRGRLVADLHQFIAAPDLGPSRPVVAIVGGLLLIAATFARQRPGT